MPKKKSNLIPPGIHSRIKPLSSNFPSEFIRDHSSGLSIEPIFTISHGTANQTTDKKTIKELIQPTPDIHNFTMYDGGTDEMRMPSVPPRHIRSLIIPPSFMATPGKYDHL